MAKGRKAKGIDVNFNCPKCGCDVQMRLKRVVDEPGTPAVSHYEPETIKATGNGLFEKGQENARDGE